MALSGVRDSIDDEGLQTIKDMDASEEIFDNYSPLADIVQSIFL